MNLVEVVGIRLDDAGNAPMLILQEVDAPARKLEIWIGAVEAGAIAFAEQGITPARPLTHDLALNLLTAAGISVVSVSVTDIQDSIFLAEIELSNGQRVSARPSDAVAIALRASVSIFVAEHVLAVAGTVEAVQPISQEEDLEAFRSFLEDLNPEDFEKDA